MRGYVTMDNRNGDRPWENMLQWTIEMKIDYGRIDGRICYNGQ